MWRIQQGQACAKPKWHWIFFSPSTIIAILGDFYHHQPTSVQADHSHNSMMKQTKIIYRLLFRGLILKRSDSVGLIGSSLPKEMQFCGSAVHTERISLLKSSGVNKVKHLGSSFLASFCATVCFLMLIEMFLLYFIIFTHTPKFAVLSNLPCLAPTTLWISPGLFLAAATSQTTCPYTPISSVTPTSRQRSL